MRNSCIVSRTVLQFSTVLDRQVPKVVPAMVGNRTGHRVGNRTLSHCWNRVLFNKGGHLHGIYER